MEKENFRANLCLIRERFGDKALIPIKDAAEYIGCDPRTLRYGSRFPVKKLGRMYYVAATALASWLS